MAGFLIALVSGALMSEETEQRVGVGILGAVFSTDGLYADLGGLRSIESYGSI